METNQSTTPSYQPPQQQQPGGTLLSGKRVLIILGILALLLVIVLALAGKNQPSSSTEPTAEPSVELSPTSASSTGVYTNPKTGISFSHPPQLMVNDVSADIISVSSIEGQADPDAPVTGMHISIFSGNKVADQLDLARDLFTVPYTKDVEIHGVVAKEISGYGKGVLQGKFIKFVEIYTNGKTYELSYFEGEPNFTKETFDEIVASFKFTK